MFFLSFSSIALIGFDQSLSPGSWVGHSDPANAVMASRYQGAGSPQCVTDSLKADIGRFLSEC